MCLLVDCVDDESATSQRQTCLPALEEELAMARSQMERLLKEGKDAADAWRGKVAALEAEAERQREDGAARVAVLAPAPPAPSGKVPSSV